MRRVDSLEKTLMLGGIEGRRRRGWQSMRWLDDITSPTRWTWVWVNSGSWWWTGRPGVLQFMGSQRVGHDWATEMNWKYQLVVALSTFQLRPLPLATCITFLTTRTDLCPIWYLHCFAHSALPFCNALSQSCCVELFFDDPPEWLLYKSVPSYFTTPVKYIPSLDM